MRDKILYYYNSAPITQKDIEGALRKAGLEEGDIAMVHSDVGVFGKLGNFHNREQFLDSILSAFSNVLGEDGTLIIPAFTYSFCKKEVFDVNNTPSSVGIFAEHARKKDGAIRSLEPIFSCAGIGRHAKKMLRDVSNVCFGKDSIFDRLYKMDGKLVLFGRPFDITYIHYIEYRFKVNYRSNKIFPGTIIDENGKKYDCKFDYYARYLDRDIAYSMENLGDQLFKRGLMKKVKLGHSSILLCRARDAFDVGMKMLRDNEHSFLADLTVGAKNVKIN